MLVCRVEKGKGVEFENVMMLEGRDGVYGLFEKKSGEEMREWGRVLYVGMRRGKKGVEMR